MTDHHTHIGQFYDIYTSPLELVQVMDAVGVELFASSSTSICEEDYGKVLAEMSELVCLAGNRVLPVLWIIPQMLSDGGFERFMNSGIQWRMLKIHPQLHPLSWQCGSRNLQKVIRLAKRLQIPLLIHTSEFAGCYPSLFERAIHYNPSVTFILAHGRPLDETVNMLQRYPNVLTDTAFMPIEHIAELCCLNLSHRILWGTDIPIPHYYNRKEDCVTYYKNRLHELQKAVSEKHYHLILNNHL